MVSLALQLLDIKVAPDVVDKLAEDLRSIPSAPAFTAALGASPPNPANPWSALRRPTRTSPLQRRVRTVK
jgi:hypothetical protein